MNVQIQMMSSIFDHEKNDIQKNASICRWENNFSAQHVNSIIETKFQKFCFKNKPYKKGTKFCLWIKRLYYFKSIIWLILLNSFYFRVLAQIQYKKIQRELRKQKLVQKKAQRKSKNQKIKSDCLEKNIKQCVATDCKGCAGEMRSMSVLRRKSSIYAFWLRMLDTNSGLSRLDNFDGGKSRRCKVQAFKN